MLSCRCSADPKVVKSGFYFSMATPSRPVEPSYILQARCTIFVVARAEYSENSLINTILWSIKLDALSVLCVCEQFIFDARLKWLAGCIWVVRWNRRTEAGTWRFGRMISVRLACEVKNSRFLSRAIYILPIRLLRGHFVIFIMCKMKLTCKREEKLWKLNGWFT